MVGTLPQVRAVVQLKELRPVTVGDDDDRFIAVRRDGHALDRRSAVLLPPQFTAGAEVDADELVPLAEHKRLAAVGEGGRLDLPPVVLVDLNEGAVLHVVDRDAAAGGVPLGDTLVIAQHGDPVAVRIDHDPRHRLAEVESQ